MYLLACSEFELQKRVRAIKIIDWTSDPFAGGAYAYRSVGAKGALAIVANPVEDTLYFAGEAYHDGAAMGTVEAALESSEDLVKRYF